MKTSTETVSTRLTTDSPAFWGSVIAGLVGLALFIVGAMTFVRYPGTPLPLKIALITAGAVSVSLAVYSLRRNRAAWAFSIALYGTLCLYGVLAAPRLRDTFELSIGAALVPAFIFAMIVLLQSLAADDY